MAEITTCETLIDYLDRWSAETPGDVWLRERRGGSLRELTWTQAQAQILGVAAWLEDHHARGTSMALLSRNRAHWVLADLAIIAAGSVTVPVFTTLPRTTAQYILEFAETRVLFLGEADNWPAVREVLPAGVTVITLPGVDTDYPHLRWDDILAASAGARPAHRCKASDLSSLVFTSGTTGVPKGVMQTHDSCVIPVKRFDLAFQAGERPPFLSYLPLSHIAERHLIEDFSLVCHGVITFNESPATLLPDLRATRPAFFFGPPRVWEQLQQAVIARYGSPAAVDSAFAADPQNTSHAVADFLGLDQCHYCLTAAAPTPPALIEWFVRFGVRMLEGFGQTEAMGLAANTVAVNRIGSIGKPIKGVEIRLSEEGELLVRADGLTPGYFNMPEKTAELYRDSWLHTGDKARIDEDGFIFITGRVKDYFKTTHGKFVAPALLEGTFAANGHTQQLCLLGRGYAKTVMVCVLSQYARDLDREAVEGALRAEAEKVNAVVDKHARIGALIVTSEPWTPANEVLTPTLKIRREQVEIRFGERARELAHAAAVQSLILVEWA